MSPKDNKIVNTIISTLITFLPLQPKSRIELNDGKKSPGYENISQEQGEFLMRTFNGIIPYTNESDNPF